jgi:hypothetical protein
MVDGFDISDLWVYKVVENPTKFWQFARAYVLNFVDLAIRLFVCPAISVFCERAFSFINLTYTKYRNRLSIEKVDYLCFIYINRKILDRRRKEWNGVFKRYMDQLSIEEAVEMETTILEAQIQEDFYEVTACARIKRSNALELSAFESVARVFFSV